MIRTTRATLSQTRIALETRGVARYPGCSTKAMSKQSTSAKRSTTRPGCSGSLPGAPSIQAGRLSPSCSSEKTEVAGDADADDGDDRGVLQQQVPADEPADALAEDDIAIGVGRPGLRDMPANSAYDRAAQALAMPATRNDRSTAGPCRVLRHRAGQGEDARADDAADADGGELPQPKHVLESATLLQILRLDLVNRLAAEDTRWRRAENAHVARPFDSERGVFDRYDLPHISP